MRRFLPTTIVLASLGLMLISGCGSRDETTQTPGKGTQSDGAKPGDRAANGTAPKDGATHGEGTTGTASPGQTSTGQPSTAQPTEPAESEPETLTLEPFDAPSLEELDAKVKWEPQPVLDTLELRRQYDAAHPAPISVEEALKLRNNSPEDNEKILLTLGRLPASEKDVDWDGVLIRRLAGDINRTNPLFSSSVSEADVNGLTSFGLFGIDWHLNPIGAADSLISWHTSEDRMYDKVVMRDDLTWSDGKPITAHDVVFTYQTIMNPAVPVPAQRQGTDQLRWVQAYDDQTLVFFHRRPLATNVWNIMFSVIPQHIYGKTVDSDPTLKDSDYHKTFEQKPVTGGAYEFASRTPGQEIVLRRRESYYMHNGQQVRDKPYFKEIRFKVMEDNNTALLALMTGGLHESELGAAQWTSQTNGNDYYRNATKASGEEWTFFYFGWNLKDPLFADVKVRQAMGYAFDHDQMLNRLNYGLYAPCLGIFHPASWMAPKNPPRRLRQDLDRASDLLEQAGWKDTDGDGVLDKVIDGKKVKFEFDILVSDKPDRIEVCNLLKQNLDRINVKCNVRVLEAAAHMKRTHDKDFQAYFAGWGAGADPDHSENLWKTGEARNFTSFSSKEVDDLFNQGKKEFDREKRAAIYGRIAELVWEQQPYTFLYHRASFYGFNKKLRGYMFSPRGPYSYGPGIGSIWAAQ